MALNPSMSVLLVDDSKLMINIIRGLLQHLGINDVDDANDGASALAKMREQTLRPGDFRLEHGADERL